MRTKGAFWEVFEEGEDLDDFVADRGVFVGGSERKAAVASHDRGDPIARERCEIGLPPHDAVEMGVALDEAGRHIAAAGIEDPLAVLGCEIGSYFCNVAITKADVGTETWRSGSIDDGPPSDQLIRCAHALSYWTDVS
jgi:hypothetical protein